jgi:hypothetical protein
MNVVVWDLETVPDLRGFAAAYGLDGKTEDDVRAEVADKFPKLICHSMCVLGFNAGTVMIRFFQRYGL